MNKGIEFNNSTHKDWHVLSIIGSVDITTSPDAEKVGTAFLNANDKVAVDMSAMNYISSSGLRVFLRLAKQAKRANKKLVFFGATGIIEEVFATSGMDMLVTMYNSKDDLP